MKKTLTYTPTNLRKNLFKICQKASDNKDNVRITIKPKNNSDANNNLIMLKENKVAKWKHAYEVLKKQNLLNQIAHDTKGLSGCPTFTNPIKFQKWSEKIGD